jgi:hypothetical protein
MEQASVENLAALLSLLQLTLFCEVTPSKSRPLLRSALSHYRELQDVAETDEERAGVRKTFGFALFTSDCLIAACARRKPLISDEDLRAYFPHNDTKIVVPRLPFDELLPIVQKLVGSMQARETALRSGKHLLACWVAALQRRYAVLASRTFCFSFFLCTRRSFGTHIAPFGRIEVLADGIRMLWQVRAYRPYGPRYERSPSFLRH